MSNLLSQLPIATPPSSPGLYIKNSHVAMSQRLLIPQRVKSGASWIIGSKRAGRRTRAKPTIRTMQSACRPACPACLHLTLVTFTAVRSQGQNILHPSCLSRVLQAPLTRRVNGGALCLRADDQVRGPCAEETAAGKAEERAQSTLLAKTAGKVLTRW